MSGGRDARKGKVYGAENRFWYALGGAVRPLPQATLTDGELVLLLERLLALGGASITRVELTEKRGGGASYRGRRTHEDGVELPEEEKVHRFEFGKRAKVYWVAIHEVAHALVRERTAGNRTYYSRAVLSHGWQFIAAYVDLVSRFYDATTAQGLLAAFRAARLSDLPPRYFRWSITNPEWAEHPSDSFRGSRATREVIAATAEEAAQEAWNRPLRYKPRKDSWGFVTNEQMLGEPALVAKKLGTATYEELVADIEKHG